MPYEKWIELFGERCGICDRPPGPTRRLDRDHDHRTGAARGLLCHRCNRGLPNWVDAAWLRAAVEYVERAEQQGGKRPVTKLVEAGLFIPADGGFCIKDYLDWNPTREDVRALRGKDARKHALHRDRELVDAVRARDGSVCRYCGTEVEWTDRRSSKGGTYDHVDPEGGNEPENVVVACRGCNAVKGKRTPDQAGIKLRPNPDLIPIRSGSRSGAGPVSVPNGTPTPTPTVRTSTAHARSGG
jgi:5-methylcytosine-specific restriction endonuclease McrA